ncbi:transmembrane protein 272-like isoform X3 [Esox lucius]|nr:transmembrane protein 272-like isoform X3 [Esox lucius]
MNKKLSTQDMVSSNVVPFAMLVANIVIGSVYLNDCPRQPYIPIYLIVLGAMGVVPVFSSCCCLISTPDSTSSLKVLCNICSGLVSLFLLCWFICGNVWIYSIYQPNYNKNIPNYNQTLINNLYCNRTLYLFAFWSNILAYLILLGLCVVLCCGCCCGLAISACIGCSKAESVQIGDKSSPEEVIM